MHVTRENFLKGYSMAMVHTNQSTETMKVNGSEARDKERARERVKMVVTWN